MTTPPQSHISVSLVEQKQNATKLQEPSGFDAMRKGFGYQQHTCQVGKILGQIFNPGLHDNMEWQLNTKLFRYLCEQFETTCSIARKRYMVIGNKGS